MTEPYTVSVGLDIALARSGWAGIDYETGQLVGCGYIDTDPALPLVERLAQLRRGVSQALRSFDGAYLDIGIEAGFQAPNGAVTRKLAMAWGVAALCCYDHVGYVPAEFAPTEVKMAATGGGKASKADVMHAAIGKWGNLPPVDDVADAAWIAYLTRQQLQRAVEDMTNGNRQ